MTLEELWIDAVFGPDSFDPFCCEVAAEEKNLAGGLVRLWPGLESSGFIFTEFDTLHGARLFWILQLQVIQGRKNVGMLIGRGGGRVV